MPDQQTDTPPTRCSCGAVATVTIPTEKFGDVPWCGLPHRDEMPDDELPRFTT